MTTEKSGEQLKIPESAVMEAFREAKLHTDKLIIDYKINNFAETIYPMSIRLYCEHVLYIMSYRQMTNFIERLVSKLDCLQGPLRILEMNAGTGGTKLRVAPLLARSNVSVEYTFTDLSPLMVVAALLLESSC